MKDLTPFTLNAEIDDLAMLWPLGWLAAQARPEVTTENTAEYAASGYKLKAMQ